MRSNQRIRDFQPKYGDVSDLCIVSPRRADVAEHQLPLLKCDLHGDTRDIVVICRHLADAEAKSGYQYIPPGGVPCRAIVWCARCEEIRKELGNRTPEIGQEPDLKLGCLPCYLAHVAEHNIQLVAWPA